MNISRVGSVRITKIDGGVRIECDLSERPNQHWSDAFDDYQRVAPYFNSIRVSGSKIIAESPGAPIADLTVAIDKRIDSANLRVQA